LCVPSRFGILTGNYASRATNRWMRELHRMHGHTFVHQESYLVPDNPNLAKDLKALGYVTGAVGKNHVIEVPDYVKPDARENLADHRVLARLEMNQRACVSAFCRAGFDYAARIYHSNPTVLGPKPIQVHNLDWIHEGAVEFIDRYRDRPFFLYYAVTVPHVPRNGWQSDPRATPVGILAEPPKGLPPRESIAARLRAAGLGEDRGDMLWLDDCVGSLLAKLREHCLLDRTIIVYLSDHGDEGGKTTCYQGGMRTIGFVWGPPRLIRGGRQVPALASTVDLAPTLLELCGGRPAPGRYDGVSLRPLLTGEADTVRHVLYGEMGHTRAVRKGQWKYIALRYSDYVRNLPLAERQAWLAAANDYQRRNSWATFAGNDPRGPFGHSGYIPDLWDHERVARNTYPHFFDDDQLYNLSKDPHEQRNLATDPRYRAVLEEMKSELKKLLETLPGDFGEFKQGTTTLLPMSERIRIGRELMKEVFH
jgi:arylsulfatase A-like enzyme